MLGAALDLILNAERLDVLFDLVDDFLNICLAFRARRAQLVCDLVKRLGFQIFER